MTEWYYNPYVLTIIMILIFSIILNIIVVFGKRCDHKWEIINEEVSKNSFGQYFKILTLKCTKCGNIKIKKRCVN